MATKYKNMNKIETLNSQGTPDEIKKAEEENLGDLEREKGNARESVTSLEKGLEIIKDKIREILDEMPTAKELAKRYEAAMNNGRQDYALREAGDMAVRAELEYHLILMMGKYKESILLGGAIKEIREHGWIGGGHGQWGNTPSPLDNSLSELKMLIDATNEIKQKN